MALFLAAFLFTSHFRNHWLTVSHSLWRIMPEFLGGMALYRIGRDYRLVYCGHWVLATFVGALILLMHFGTPDLFIVPLFGGLILIAAEQSRRNLQGLLTSKVFVYLGQISYSLYMLHFIFIVLFVPVWPLLIYKHIVSPVVFYPVYGLTLALVLPAAALCYRFIEQPSRLWMTRVLLDGPAHVPRLRSVLTGVSVIIPCMFGAMMFEQNRMLTSPMVFNSHILDSGEDPANALRDLGYAYAAKGQYDLAIGQYRLALAQSDGLPPDVIPGLHVDLALAYLRVRPGEDGTFSIQALIQVLPFSSQIPEAIQELNIAVQLAPDTYWANKMLAVIYAYQGDNEKASFYNLRAEISSQRK
jgi:hypothetical protein